MFNPLVRDSFLGEFDSIFNNLTKPTYSVITGQIRPKANISKDENSWQIDLAVPGLSRADFNIEVEDKILTISVENNHRNENSVRQEYSFNKFSRSFSLPENVNTDNIEAQYVAGILSLNIPVMDVNINKAKKIEVN